MYQTQTNVVHLQQPPPQQAPPPRTRTQAALPRFDRVHVYGIPSVTVENDQLVVGDGDTTSARTYTPIKVVGDGSFGTVWLVDWHGTLPPNTPLSAMQRNAGARPEYAGKRLVAVKRMKKTWSGWDECKSLKELESLRIIPYHPNVIPLYDFFLLPDSKELYFVFESMEGNLYQLIRSRKNRPLAGGLVASIFQQVIHGLHHIHAAGYFHRDMKPENLLVTTTGLFDYQTLNPVAPPGTPPEKDVVVICKIADFGLARETSSSPPYTEYVSTRWYRAPEVLLRSRSYSNPVDMWAFGAIMAELIDLRPLFPGDDEMDQVVRIAQILGEPSDQYGTDARGKPFGGGKWDKGHKLAARVGFTFAPSPPANLFARFHHSVPPRLVECVVDLLRYDPEARLTSKQCVDHAYLKEAARVGGPSVLPSTLRASASEPNVNRPVVADGPIPPVPPLPTIITRVVPPSHSGSTLAPRPAFNAGPDSHRTSFYASADPSAVASMQSSVFDVQQAQPINAAWPASTSMPNIAGQGEPMEISLPGVESPAQPIGVSPIVTDTHHTMAPPAKQGKFGSLSFGAKKSKWGLNFFNQSDKHAPLPPVEEGNVSTPSLKRSQTSGSDHSMANGTTPVEPVVVSPMDAKKKKKEAEQIRLEAERAKRALAKKAQIEASRAVMQKKNANDWQATTFEAHNLIHQAPPASAAEAVMQQAQQAHQAQLHPRHAVSGVVRTHHTNAGANTVGAAGGRYMSPPVAGLNGVPESQWRDPINGRLTKIRRRDWEDDHSISSSDVHSVSRMSAMSFATVDSDPGPARLRHRPSLFGVDRMTSSSSFRTSFDTAADSADVPYSYSVRSGGSSIQYEQLAEDFGRSAVLDYRHHGNGNGNNGASSPPPMHLLSLSPNHKPWHSPSGHSDAASQHSDSGRHRPSYLQLPPPGMGVANTGRRSSSPYEFGLPSPGFAPKSAINPMFQVPNGKADYISPSQQTLPPFSQLEAVAEGEYPPLSPMSFYRPQDDDLRATPEPTS